jgi:hypothetical protein
MGEYICTICHYVGMPKTAKRGSGKIEKFGWMIFPLGLPYTLWRIVSKIRTCRHCGCPVVPVNSNEGRRLEAMEMAALGPIAPIKPKAPPPPKAEPVKPAPKPEVSNQDPTEW